MIKSDSERQAPQKVGDAEPSHLVRYDFARSLITANEVVLDVPCGSGYGTRVLAQSAKHVTGVDISADAILHAQEFFFAPNVDFQVGDGEQLSKILTDKALFDVVVSFEGIEHVPHPEALLNEIKGVLAPSGKLIISTPRKPHGSPHHIIEFTLEEFKEILSLQFHIETMYGQIYTDIFDLSARSEDPNAYKRFNFIAICKPK